MIKNIFYLISLIILSCFPLTQTAAQCAIGNNVAGNSCTSTTFAKSTIQTFKPTCSGVLNTVVAPSVSIYSDDLRSSGYYVMARIRSSDGTLLASSAPTDKWYPGATVSFDLLCSNLHLAVGTTYQLEFYETTGTTDLVLFCKSSSSIYGDGNLIQDGVVSSNSDINRWQVNILSESIASAASSQSQNVNTCGRFINSSSELLAFVKPGATNGVSGTAAVKVWIEDTQPNQFVKRHYEITPAINAAIATGRVTLYFTQSEFDQFNAVNTTDLPASGSDASGKANLRIEKRSGTSSSGLPESYSGTASTIDPSDADIVWNSPLNRWEITFDVTGFSGFFVKTSTSPLPVTLISFDVEKQENQSLLTWTTSAELNSERFEVQRSEQGQIWENIGSVTAAKNSSSMASYEFKDSKPHLQENLYRLKMIDNDGSFSYSRIGSITFDSREDIFAFPNPATDATTLTIDKKYRGTQLSLINASGLLLRKIRIVSENIPLDLSGYVPGIYLLLTPEGKTVRINKQ